MTISLADIEFVNDFYSFSLPSGDVLNLNNVQEDFLADADECIVNTINMYINPADSEDEEQIHCPSVIGIENDYFKLSSDYTEFQGKVLTAENMAYCYIEVADE